MPSNNVPSALTQAAKDGIAGLVQNYVAAGFRDLNYAAQNLPGFLADTGPVTAAALPTKTIVRAACRSYARGGGPQNLPAFDAVWSGLCEPYLQSIGEDPSDGAIGPPLKGGQCPVQYNVTFNATGASGACNPIEFGTTTVSAGVGPISIRKFHNTAQSGQSGGLCPGFTYNNVLLRNAAGESTLVGQGRGVRLNSISVARVGGGLDNCGDPPVEFDPPDIPPNLPAAPVPSVRIPGLGPVNVGVTFSPSGDLVVSLPDVGVTVNVPDPTKPATPTPSPGGGTPPPGDVGSPGAPSSVGAGGEVDGSAPAGTVLTGLRVQITAFPPSRSKFTEEVYRGAYYVYMGVAGLLDLDFGGAMVRADQFFFSEKENLTRWRVRANTGYELVVTPYYRAVT